MTRVPLAQLQTFVDIARTGKLAHAAKQLNLTVSALSHQMQALESAANIKLLRRETRGVQLTEAGRKLLESIEAPLAAITLAWRSVRASTQPNCLCISVLPSIASAWLMPRLPRFTEANPVLELSLLSSTDLVDFAHSDVDLAIRFGGGSWPGLITHHLMNEYLTPLISPALLEKHQARLGPPTLERLHLWPLLGDPAERWSDWQQQTGSRAPERYVAQFSDSETLHRAAVEGMGIALGRLSMAQSLIANGLLQPMFARRIQSNFAHYLVYPERSANKKSVQIFRDWLLLEVS
jgi:LysR family transcriptional regulator, glycine cleavage system transcriptional activator